MPWPTFDEALAELLRRCIAWRIAAREDRCECGRRAQRTPEAVSVALQTELCERVRERLAFDAEATTRPATPRRPDR